MKRTCEYTKADNFIFPLMENICMARGIPFERVTDLFSARCEGCGTAINGEALSMAACMIVTSGSFPSSCPKCGSKRFVGTVAGLTPGEEESLLNDKFFRTLQNPDK